MYHYNFACVCVCVYICIYVYMSIQMHAKCMYMCVYVHVLVHVCAVALFIYVADIFLSLLSLQEPVEIDLNAPSHVLECAGSKRQHNTIQSSKFCYISIIDSLKAMLKNEDVLKEVLCSHKSSGAKLGDFCDGKALRRDQVFSDFNALQIVAYYDDLEICNPLGAASKRHKIGVFFFFLGNIHPCYRSSLSISQLFAVAKSIDIKTYGIDEILKPFVSEIKILATEGLTIEHGSVNHTFKGNLIAFLADNLASHTVGGFKESMGFAFRFCRKCLATKQQSQTRFTSSQFVQRTPSEHAQQCRRLTGPLKDHYSVTYGITRNAILNTIPNISVITGLCHDIMHDLFEGVAPLEMKLLIQYCVQNGYFSLRDLNTRISQFDFGYSNTSDKPAKFEESSTGKLKLTASSMWLLARMLPIIIGELVPENDKNWQCYITLLKIINICTSHECTVDTVAYLSSLIEEHHKIFTEIYPGEFIPKMHSMVHYPEQILEFGPIINTWCMRMEAKLRICKRIAKFGNFKNVCLSVTCSHQRWMCLQLQSKTFLKSPPEIGGRLVTHTIQEEDANVRDILTQIIRTLSTHTQYVIFHPTWVKLQNTEYKKGAIILTGFNNQLPVFGKIIDLCVIDDSLWFIYEQFKTNWFDLHYHSFCVTPTTSLSYISLSQLAYPFVLHVLHVYLVQNCCYVVLKYGLDFL